MFKYWLVDELFVFQLFDWELGSLFINFPPLISLFSGLATAIVSKRMPINYEGEGHARDLILPSEGVVGDS